MKIIYKSDFAVEYKDDFIKFDGDTNAENVFVDLAEVDKAYKEVCFEFKNSFDQKYKTKTFTINNNRTIEFEIPKEVTDTIGLVELQAVLIGDAKRKKTEIIIFEVNEALNAENSTIVGGGGFYCPMLKFEINSNGFLTLYSTDESEKLKTTFVNETLFLEAPDRYEIEDVNVNKNGQAELNIKLEEE